MSLAHHAAADSLPRLGLDRPHVSVTVSLEALRGIGSASLIGVDASSLTASEAGRLARDANLMPLVLGGRSDPLEVGRERHLVTGGILAALACRDADFASLTAPSLPRSARPTASSRGTTAVALPLRTSSTVKSPLRPSQSPAHL